LTVKDHFTVLARITAVHVNAENNNPIPAATLIEEPTLMVEAHVETD
jgi:hypothetical protein